MGKIITGIFEMGTIVDWITILIAIIAIVISIISMIESNGNSVIDRRVNVYTEAIVSIENIAFHGWSEEMGYGEVFNVDVDDNWMRNQILKAVEINAELKMYDEETAKRYWEIVSQIFGPEHCFDFEKYEEFRNTIKKEIN